MEVCVALYVSELGSLNYTQQGLKVRLSLPPAPCLWVCGGEVIYLQDSLLLVFSSIFYAVAHFLCYKSPREHHTAF